jgi:lactoylglutathione lyase
MTDAIVRPEQVVFNHVGLCVTDLERSRKFYENVLQFRYWWELDAPEEGTGILLQLPQPIGLQAVYMVRDGLVLELLHYRSADVRPWRKRIMAEPGLTHLSFSVGDVAEAVSRVVPNGGQVIEETDIKAAVMIRDPDGQLIELTSADWVSSLPPLPS